MNAVRRALEAIAAADNPAAELRARLERERAADKRKAEHRVEHKVAGRMKPTSEQLDAETARLRVRAMHRSEGRGELCGRIFDPETVQLCHLDGGSGKRRQDQWIGNVLMEHPECHTDGPDSLDHHPEAWLPEIKAWCKRNGYPLPERFRRIEIKAQHRRRAS